MYPSFCVVRIALRRWVLSKKDKKKLLSEIAKLYPKASLSRDLNVEIVVEDNIRLYLFNSVPAFIELYYNNRRLLIPHLKYLLKVKFREWLPVIVVDEGAIKPISRGADLMRPGILRIEGVFKSGSIVVVVEPNRGLPLAIHLAQYGSEEIKDMDRGRVSKSLHHLGDKYWRLAESL
jgi:PUA domain protein